MAEKYKQVITDMKNQAERLMSKEQITKCSIAIHTASIASAAAGAIPIPVADALPITAAQITMVMALGKVFETKVTESIAKGLIGATASTFVGRNIVKMIPIFGWGVSAAVAAGVTEAIGWTIAVDFAKDAKSRWEESQKHTNDSHQSNTCSDNWTTENSFAEESDTGNSETAIDNLIKCAEEFVSGNKKRSEYNDEYSTLLSDIERILDDLNDNLDKDRRLKELYDRLCLIIE